MAANEDGLRSTHDEARHRYKEALVEMRRVETILRDVGGDHPDGNQALHNANRRLAFERANFERALTNFSDAVLWKSTGGGK